MQNMSRTELLRLLDDMRKRVAEGDSLEGQLRFKHTSCKYDVDQYDVAAVYRAGSGVRMVGAGTDPIRCTRCTNDDGPFTPSGLCEPCARPMPLDGAA